jgi:hypothetical protein
MRKCEKSYIIRESKVSDLNFSVELSTLSTEFSFKLGGLRDTEPKPENCLRVLSSRFTMGLSKDARFHVCTEDSPRSPPTSSNATMTTVKGLREEYWDQNYEDVLTFANTRRHLNFPSTDPNMRRLVK